MPFLHWLRKKSRSTKGEDEASTVERSTPEQIIAVPEAASEKSGHESSPDAPSTEPQIASIPLILLSATQTAEEPESAAAEPAQTSHFSVPVGAFYAKLPPDLMAAERPDLTRPIELAEADVVIERETQEATVSLSILSLSCPEIFVRPVADSDDIPITFSLYHQLPATVAEPPDQPAGQPLQSLTEARESPSAEDAGKTDEPLEVEHLRAEAASGADPGQPGRIERHPAPTLGATIASGKIPLPSIAGDRSEREIRLRLEPILSYFPPGLEYPSIGDLSETKAEIVLPLEVIESQLANGRVVVSAALFCSALPNDLKPYFETIDPTAEIPIPLREIFLRLPPEVIKLRKDQDIDFPEPRIQTPFSEQAEEDAKRFGVAPEAPTSPGPGPRPDGETSTAPKEAGTPVPAFSGRGSALSGTAQNVSSPLAPPRSGIPAQADSERLQAIFMTDEDLDLPKTIRLVADLPGLRACLLNTTDGRKLAGSLDDPSQEQAVSALVPELFQQARSRLASMRLGMLETITLYCGRNQLSAFIEGKLCLTVLHDNRPFKPGVREKVQAVIRELVTLNPFEKEA